MQLCCRHCQKATTVGRAVLCVCLVANVFFCLSECMDSKLQHAFVGECIHTNDANVADLSALNDISISCNPVIQTMASWQMVGT